MITILVADDHPVVRHGLTRILEGVSDFTVVGEAATGEQLLEIAKRIRTNVALVDVSMPGPGILALLGGLARVGHGIAALVLSLHPEEQYAVPALKAGAAGYLTKDCSPDELITAVRRVASGRRYVSLGLADRLARNLQTGSGGLPHEQLSDREFEVLRLLGTGQSVGEIGKKLFLSPKTVSTYRARLLEKMGLESNAQIIRYSVEKGLVD